MATIQIHEDQENRRPEGKPRQGLMAVQQKRAALGMIDKTHNQNVLKEKQTFASINNINNENWNFQKEKRKNIVNPIVPVAQFEAFKVYEDVAHDERMAKIEAKLKAKSTSFVYKGTEDDRFFTKTEVAELERKGVIPPSSKEEEEEEEKKSIECDLNLSPMSIDRSEHNQSIRYNNEAFKYDFFIMEEYNLDIYQYLRQHELQNRAKPGYMKKQPDVTSSMRTILVDWLVEVAEEYKLQTETLYLAVNYIDRFLSYMSVVRAKLQLVGTAAMFLASKYEEIYCPNIEEFVYITDDTYTKRQVIRMEHLILKVLGFDLSVPTPLTFITAICAINKVSQRVKFLGMFLCELALLDGDSYLEFLPSMLAASAIVVAQHTLDEEVWNNDFVKSTQYELSKLKPCVEFLYNMFKAAPNYPQHAIQDKYASPKFMSVSQLSPKERLNLRS